MSGIDPGPPMPRLRRGVKLRFDAARNTWVLLAPEKAFVLDEIAFEIMNLVDGNRSLEAICATLSEKFDAPLDTVTTDVSVLLKDLSQKGAVEL